MSDNQIKTSIEGLTVGMYVTRLDRPWVETEFPFQGLKISDQAEIEMLRKYCHYVYVDLTLGVSPEHRFWIIGNRDELKLTDQLDASEIFTPQDQNEYTKLKKCFYKITTKLELELENAREVHDKVAKNTQKVLKDIQKGKSLDIDLVKEGVAATVESVIRNPSALMLLLQMENSDDYVYSHALGTSVWCAQFGRHLGLERTDINNLALGGMLLDVGKLQIDNAILSKRQGLSAQDLKVIATHIDKSVQIVARTGGVSHEVLRMIATHHERFDGSGYPAGLREDEIPLFGRIAGIIDSYDAMTSIRPYIENVFTPHEAINELYHCRNSIFQPELVEQFIQTVGLYPTGSLVEFNTGQVGVVVSINDLKRLFPTVMLLLDQDKAPLSEFVTIDLSRQTDTSLSIKQGLPHGAFGIKMNELFL